MVSQLSYRKVDPLYSERFYTAIAKDIRLEYSKDIGRHQRLAFARISKHHRMKVSAVTIQIRDRESKMQLIITLTELGDSKHRYIESLIKSADLYAIYPGKIRYLMENTMPTYPYYYLYSVCRYHEYI